MLIKILFEFTCNCIFKLQKLFTMLFNIDKGNNKFCESVMEIFWNKVLRIIFTGIVFKFHMHVHNKQKNRICIERTHGHFWKKSPEYANNHVKKLAIYYNITATLCKSFCDDITWVSIASFTMSSDVHHFGSHCYPWHKPFISIFWIFAWKVIESSLKY